MTPPRTGAERQAAFKARQRAEGRVRVTYWLTPEERRALDVRLFHMRQERKEK